MHQQKQMATTGVIANNQHPRRQAVNCAAEDPIFPIIRQGQLFRDQQIQQNLANIYSQVNKRESVLSANAHGTALAFSQVSQQIQKLQLKENELLTKIENEIIRRQ